MNRETTYRCRKPFYRNQYHNQCYFKHCLTLIRPLFPKNSTSDAFAGDCVQEDCKMPYPFPETDLYGLWCWCGSANIFYIRGDKERASQFPRRFNWTHLTSSHRRQMIEKVWPMGVTWATEIWLNNRNVNMEGRGYELCCRRQTESVGSSMAARGTRQNQHAAVGLSPGRFQKAQTSPILTYCSNSYHRNNCSIKACDREAYLPTVYSNPIFTRKKLLIVIKESFE